MKNMTTLVVAATVLAIVLVPTAVMAGTTKTPAQNTATDVAVGNPSFEADGLLPATWTKAVPGWQLLPGSNAGVWRPGTSELPTFGFIDGNNVMWINTGGASQTLPVAVQTMTDYTVSLEWFNRSGFNKGNLSLQFFAGDQLLATCAPTQAPSLNKSMTVTLLFHSNSSTGALSQPLSIRIANTQSGTQLDVDDVQVQVANSNGSKFTQECKTALAQ